MKRSDEKAYLKILKDIESIKIQGAKNVAIAGIKAYTLNPTNQSYKKILSLRPTEPLLQNSLKILKNSKSLKKDSKKILKKIEISQKKAAKAGAKLIKNNMNVFSHCHSSTVMDILKYAKKINKKKFVVYTTEVEPLLQGRITAKDLSKSGIKVCVFPDLAAEQALKKCDIFLFGADAYTKNCVANKIGTSTFVKLAKIHDVPRYSCGISLKFTSKIKIKLRDAKEVWNTKIKRIKVINPPFDKTPIKSLTGVISEFGIKSPKEFSKLAKESSKMI